MRYIGLFSSMLVLSFVISSCAPSVSVTKFNEKRPPKPAEDKIFVFFNTDKLSDKCVPLGEISVYDAGLAVNCGFYDVLFKAMDQAKEIGADAIKVTEVKKPDLLSTCYRIKALAIAYNGLDTNKITKADFLAPPDSNDIAFLSFKDCYSSNEPVGSIGSLSKSTTIINLLSFFEFTVYSDKTYDISDTSVTKPDLNFSAPLAHNGWNVNYIDKKSNRFNSCLKFYTGLLHDITSGEGNPLDWGEDAYLNLRDENAIVYMPFVVKRETQMTVSARLYVLIANSKGKILYCRCLDFDPGVWTYNFDLMANDIESWLPLARD